MAQFSPIIALRYLFVLALVLLSCHVQRAGAQESLWLAAEFAINAGTARSVEGGVEITTNKHGVAFVSIPGPASPLQAYTRARLIVKKAVPGQLFLAWNSRHDPDSGYEVPLSAPDASGSIVLKLQGLEYWEGQAANIGLRIQAAPGASLVLQSLEIYRPSAAQRVEEMRVDWGETGRWVSSDINFYSGVRRNAVSSEPVPLLALLAAVLLGLYVVYTFLFKRAGEFNWRVIGSILLLVWLLLDLLWFARLAGRAGETFAQFRGMSPQEKVQASADANAASFAAAIKEKVQGSSARLFIVSQSDHASMLTSYYLAPLNVYWNRPDMSLPDVRYLRPGDYVVAVNPHDLAYSAKLKAIRVGENTGVPVDILFMETYGALLQVGSQ